MGITGLLPFLSKSSRRANVKEFAGQTVAIDAYCWLHKGAFSCADKLVMKEPTVMYVSYCMKFINMLLSHNIKPILVFDGRYLPAKAETEKKRRESRAFNRKKGAELMRAGQVEEGRSYLRRSLDVSHEMALNLIKECRSRNIDCIVAPHEADAQLAYLNVKNIAQVVITEDSDLLLFGCVKVLFKMDINGNGLLIERDRLHISMGIRHDSFSIDKFRHMCILSGCDYLPSLPGIGLGKAKKFINRISEQNIYEALLKLPVSLQMWSLIVTDDYRNGFIEAERTFKYQLVYDPILRKQVPLNESENENDFVGEKLDENVAFQLAIGNMDPMTLKQMDSYDPDKAQFKRNIKNFVTSHQSIWNANFTPRVTNPKPSIFPLHSSTKGITVTASLTSVVKRPPERESSPERPMTKEILFNLYSHDKEQCETKEEAKNKYEETPVNASPQKSPVLFRKKNPFAQQFPSNSSTKKRCLGGLARFKLNLESGELLSSRYFAEKEIDTTPVTNKGSVLDIINEQERSSCKSPNEEEKLSPHSENSEPVELDNSSSEIQRKLSKFTFLSGKDFKNYLDDDEVKTSQKEIHCSLPNSEPIMDDDKKESVCVTPKKTVLTPLNRVYGMKNFYTSEQSSENCDNSQTSPYFARKSEERVSAVLLSKSPKKCSSVTYKRKTFKNVGKKCSVGKQQSLLTKFGFQQRPKLQSEMT